MTTSETGAVHDKSGWYFVEESISSVTNELLEDKSCDVSNQEYMLAMVIDAQQREDVSTTASDGDANPRTAEGEQEEVEEEGDARFERRAQRQRREDHDHHRLTSSSTSHPEGILPNVPRSGGHEYKIDRAAKGSKKQDLGGKTITRKAKHGDQRLASVNKICQRRNKVACDEAGCYIENKASEGKVPMLVENEVCVVDEYVKGLIDTGG